MSITFRILGAAGRDNALLLQVDSGQAIERLLFDCGDGCLSELPFGDIPEIDHLFFSHLHMDHVGGFDIIHLSGAWKRPPNRVAGGISPSAPTPKDEAGLFLCPDDRHPCSAIRRQREGKTIGGRDCLPSSGLPGL